MASLSKSHEIQAVFERPRVRLVVDETSQFRTYKPATDHDMLVMQSLGWPTDSVFGWEMRDFEQRVFASHRAIDVIETVVKRNTWTGEPFV